MTKQNDNAIVMRLLYKEEKVNYLIKLYYYKDETTISDYSGNCYVLSIPRPALSQKGNDGSTKKNESEDRGHSEDSDSGTLTTANISTIRLL